MKNDNNCPKIIIESIIFNDKSKVKFKDNDIVLFVGANNVGKSRTLKDIHSEIYNDNKKKIICNDINIKEFNFNVASMNNYFKKNYPKPSNGVYNVIFENNSNYPINEYEIENCLNLPNQFYKFFCTYLSTENRLQLTKPVFLRGNYDEYCLSYMNKLDESEKAIDKLNELLKIDFQKGVEIYNDSSPTNPFFSYKIGNNDDISNISNSNRRAGNHSLKELDDLHNQGDGIRSTVAILLSLIVNDQSLFLIDEPETFLHPPQAKELGRNIVKLSKDKQCFITSHNIDFIRGLLEEGAERLKIIKIDRNENENQFYVLDNEKLLSISKDKNLKYTNILNGLFYKQVVLCEDESDCKFYSSILESIDFNLYQDTLFCAVGGKDQFKRIFPLLQELKIKCLIIADIDLINNKDKLKQLLNSIKNDNYSEIESDHVKFLKEFAENKNREVKTQGSIKQAILNILRDDNSVITEEQAQKIKLLVKNISPYKQLKVSGKSCLPAGECTIMFNNILTFLKRINIFVLECGEIERFIPEISAHGNKWVEDVFNTYRDMNNPIYNDAKKFIKQVFQID